MNELIKIENKNGIETVNARELHNFLESKQRFSDWIKNRIEKYEFKEGYDFIKVSENYDTNGGAQECINYYLSISMAKELSMVENNNKGKQARQYFINCENILKSDKNEIESLKIMFIEFMKQQTETNKALLTLIQNNQKQLDPPVEYFTISGYAKKNKIKLVSSEVRNLSNLAMKLSFSQEKRVDLIDHAQYGTVNAYHVEILKQVFDLYEQKQNQIDLFSNI